jgi:hypothetical protein
MGNLIRQPFTPPVIPAFEDPKLRDWARQLQTAINFWQYGIRFRFEEAMGQGTFAERPTANGSYRFFWATDTNQLFYDDGAWHEIAGTVDTILKSIIDAKGDLIAGTANDTPARLAVGTNGYLLEAASGATPGVQWAQRGYVDRGDPAAADFAWADVTADGTWRDLDLSGIVPVGTKAVSLYVWLSDNAVNSEIQFRKNGNSNEYAVQSTATQVANIIIRQNMIIACDTNRIIEYKITNGVSLVLFGIVVTGWFL